MTSYIADMIVSADPVPVVPIYTGEVSASNNAIIAQLRITSDITHGVLACRRGNAAVVAYIGVDTIAFNRDGPDDNFQLFSFRIDQSVEEKPSDANVSGKDEIDPVRRAELLKLFDATVAASPILREAKTTAVPSISSLGPSNRT